MEIERLLNFDARRPARGEKAAAARSGKARVEKACPSCSTRNHIRTTKCRACNAVLRVSPGRQQQAARAARAAGRKQKNATSIAALLNAPVRPPRSPGETAKALAKMMRKCPNCGGMNHIRVTACTACRRALRPTS